MKAPSHRVLQADPSLSAVLTAISHSAVVRAASSGHSQQRWTRILVHLHV
jgi:hypothetical protein